jgi:iron complex outermembrane receptor protein
MPATKLFGACGAARRLGLISIGALAGGLFWAGTATAQSGTSPGAAADANEPAENVIPNSTADIVVTGSRLARSTFSTPTPVTVLGAQEFERLAVTNAGQGLNQLPAFRPSTTPTTQGFGSFNVGANIVNLRGLGVTRNLILVDGRRFAPTTREGSVDLNLIPSILIDRTEVVTGGASAAYGSDAIAGVVNVILATRLNGLKAQVDQGISEYGDGRNFHAALAGGTDFAGGAGHIVIGGEYDNQKGIGNCFQRRWCTPGAVVTNIGYAATPTAPNGNGLPNYVRNDTNAGFFFNPGGVVLIGANAGRTFAPNGAVLPYNRGNPLFGITASGGDVYATYTDANITVPVERYATFAHADYDFSDTLHGFVEGSYGHVRGELLQVAFFSGSLPIFRDNPFIPAGLRTVLPAAASSASLGIERPAAASFTLGKVFDDVARGLSISTADTYRGTAGLSGKFSDAWGWDAYYQYGRTDRLQTVQNNLIVGAPSQPLTNNASLARSNARFYYAADAVTNPATGTPTCRALLSADPAVRQAAAGCVPVNLFGAGNVSQVGKDYIYGTLREDIRLSQHVVAGNVRGEIGELWAGPLSVAAGAEFRRDSIDVGHDALSNQFAYFQNFGSDYDGSSKVVEGYAEAELPLIRDASFTKSLSLNGAVRYAHYDISGFGSYLQAASSNKFGATSWKGSLLWEPTEWLRLRGTRSRDIRAPNFAELYLASASSFTPITNRFNTSQTAPPSIVNGGTPELRPEKADTTTLGVVLSPKSGFLDRFRLSVDYFNIKVDDYISAPPGGAQFIVDKCFAGVTAACGLLTTTGSGASTIITEVRNINLNLEYIKTRGIDIEAEYRIPLAGEDSNILLRGLATYVDSLKSASFGDVVDRAGQTGNSAGLAAPKWTVNSFVTLALPRASLTVQGRYIDSGLYDAQRIGPGQVGYSTTLLNSISDNHVAGRFYVNLFGSFHVGPERDTGFEFFGSVNNLFDKAPPAAPETQFYTNPIYFDTIGRYYRVGARFKM